MNLLIKQISEKMKELQFSDAEIENWLLEVDSKLELAEKIEECLYDSELYLVYKHTDPRGRVYIGITQNHPQTRWNEGGGYEKQTKFYRAIQKYGWIHFKHEIIAAGLSRDEAMQLENELIIEYRSYEDAFGYNVRVNIEENLHAEEKKNGSVEKSLGKPEAKKNKKDNLTQIAQSIVEEFSIQTIDDELFYLNEKGYVKETEYPMVQKLLIMRYGLQTKDHKEVMKQIEIISKKRMDELDTELRDKFFQPESEPILRWIDEKLYNDEKLFSIPTSELYANYIVWCKENKIKAIFGKKQFYKCIAELFFVEKKQKSDGKRYFVKK